MPGGVLQTSVTLILVDWNLDWVERGPVCGKHAYSKDIIVAQLALILECCRGGGGACREEDGSHSTVRLGRTTQRRQRAARTFSQVLDGFPYAPVECSGISWTLKGQAAPPVLHLPVVKRGICYGVHQVLPQRTVQNHLFTLHTSAILHSSALS